MVSLFVDPLQMQSDAVVIDGPDFHHLVNVLRVRAGDRIVVLDNQGGAFEAAIAGISSRELSLHMLRPVDAAPEPPIYVTVAQALGKGDKFEQVIQHGTEVGASAFIPLITDRTIVRIALHDSPGKRDRWALIAKGAAEQCGRSRIPPVSDPARLPETLARFAEERIPAILFHREGEPLAKALDQQAPEPTNSLILFVGPEGGFTASEVDLARASGVRVVSLGPYILRTETAALAAVSRILHHFDRLRD